MPDTNLRLHKLRLLIRNCAVAALCIGLAACAPAFDPADRLVVDLPRRAAVPDVPLIVQDDAYCGPASLAMVMQWAGRDVTQAEIAALAFSPAAGGTFQADMLGAARRQGQLAVEITGFDALLGEITAGHPVIVFQNLGLGVLPQWHYGVVTGYDFAADLMFLNSGQNRQMEMRFAVFERTWARGDMWGLVVLPPDRLPAAASQQEILSAAAALERVAQNDAAATLYRTGAARWPDNWLWPFGLGNALYASGDLRGAQTALRRARAIAPDIPEIRANLAHVTAEIAGRG